MDEKVNKRMDKRMDERMVERTDLSMVDKMNK